MNTSPPEHDDLCEAGAAAGFAPCRCADRRANAELDPTLLKMRVKRVRQATEALEKVEHTLATYVSEHADSQCQHFLPPVNPMSGPPRRCPSAVDGFILLSCGHFGFLCAHHGSVTLRAVQGGVIDCTNTDIDIHPIPARGVTIEWMSLA